ncbi:hypothetical protein VPH35_053308 [Triticum aestivum]
MDAGAAPAAPISPPRHRLSPPALHRLLIVIPGASIDWRSDGPSSSCQCASVKEMNRDVSPQIHCVKAAGDGSQGERCSPPELLDPKIGRVTWLFDAFVLVGGTVQGATPMRFLAGWMAFRRNPGAH